MLPVGKLVLRDGETKASMVVSVCRFGALLWRAPLEKFQGSARLCFGQAGASSLEFTTVEDETE